MKICKSAVQLVAGGLLILGGAGQAFAGADTPAVDDKADAALFEEVCTGCHVASQATSVKRSADQWGQTIDRMVSYGAQISDEDYYRLVDYMARHYGPDQAALNHQNMNGSAVQNKAGMAG